jgi:dolichol-phosphate mannosyltransferase
MSASSGSAGTPPDLSVVVPMHNEAASVEPLVREIHAALDGSAPYEIVLVDDGSTDGTGDRVAALSAADSRLRVVQHPARSGQSAATVTGVRAARAPWVVTLDGDGQNDPADIPRLLAALREWDAPRPGLLVGHRRERHDSFVKRASSRIANGVRARLLGDATPDTGCGLKLFRRDAFLAVPRFDHMHRFLPALFRRDGWDVRSVVVRHRPRRGGKSHYGMFNRLWVGIVDMTGVWWLARRAVRSAGPDATE